MTWDPFTKAEVEQVVRKERDDVHPERLAFIDRYAVDPYPLMLERGGDDEKAFVVARAADQAVFFEDVEGYFGIATEQDGRLVEPAIYGSLAFTIGVLEELLHPQQEAPPPPIAQPALIDPGEIAFIKDMVKRFFGPAAVIRSYGPDPARLMLHVETDREVGMEEYDCAGMLMARIDREQISLTVTRRGTRPYGEAKIAYRQGVVL